MDIFDGASAATLAARNIKNFMMKQNSPITRTELVV